jgi:hypothetical protein
MELSWKPKVGVIYHPKYTGSRHPVSTSKTTITDVYFSDGKNASYCSFKVDENDKVEIRIKSKAGKLVKAKSPEKGFVPLYTVDGTCYRLEKDGKEVVPMEETIQTRHYDKNSLKFSKFQGRSYSKCRPGGYDTRIFTYLVEA